VRGHSGRESTKRQTKFWYFVSEEGSKAISEWGERSCLLHDVIGDRMIPVAANATVTASRCSDGCSEDCHLPMILNGPDSFQILLLPLGRSASPSNDLEGHSMKGHRNSSLTTTPSCTVSKILPHLQCTWLPGYHPDSFTKRHLKWQATCDFSAFLIYV